MFLFIESPADTDAGDKVGQFGDGFAADTQFGAETIELQQLQYLKGVGSSRRQFKKPFETFDHLTLRRTAAVANGVMPLEGTRRKDRIDHGGCLIDVREHDDHIFHPQSICDLDGALVMRGVAFGVKEFKKLVVEYFKLPPCIAAAVDPDGVVIGNGNDLVFIVPDPGVEDVGLEDLQGCSFFFRGRIFVELLGTAAREAVGIQKQIEKLSADDSQICQQLVVPGAVFKEFRDSFGILFQLLERFSGAFEVAPVLLTGRRAEKKDLRMF